MTLNEPFVLLPFGMHKLLVFKCNYTYIHKMSLHLRRKHY